MLHPIQAAATLYRKHAIVLANDGLYGAFPLFPAVTRRFPPFPAVSHGFPRIYVMRPERTRVLRVHFA